MRVMIRCGCGTLHLVDRGCFNCERRALAKHLRLQREKERTERKRRAALRRERREAAESRRISEAEHIAAVAGAYDGSRGLEPMQECRFRGHGGPSAFAAYMRAYREARS